MGTISDDALSLNDYWDLLRRYAWVVALTTVAVVVTAMAVSLQRTEVYAAKTLVLVEPPGSAGGIEGLLYGSTDLQTQVEILTSRPVVERAFEIADANADVDIGTASPQSVSRFIEHQLDISTIDNTTLMEVVVSHEDPQLAAVLSHSVTLAYLAYLREDAEKRSAEAVADLNTRERTIQDQLRSVQEQLSEAPGSTQASLEEERDNLHAQLRWIATRRIELEAAQPFMRRGDIIQPALVPQGPVSPTPIRTGLLALFLGGTFGIVLAFVRGWTDGRLLNPADVARSIGTTPLSELRVTKDPQEFEEGIRILRTKLTTFLRRHSEVNGSTLTGRGNAKGFIQVASAAPDTDTAALVDSLSQSFASTGQNVAVIDLVGGTGRTHTSATASLLAYLDGRSEVAALLPASRSNPVDRLTVDAQAIHERLASPRMAELLTELCHRYDVVLVAAPAVTASTVPLDLGVHSVATILAVTTGRTERSQLNAAVGRLRQVEAPIAGVVLVVGELAKRPDSHDVNLTEAREPIPR